jgi:hypothetical protein
MLLNESVANIVNVQLNVSVTGQEILTGSDVIELNFDTAAQRRNPTLKKIPSLYTHRHVNSLFSFSLQQHFQHAERPTDVYKSVRRTTQQTRTGRNYETTNVS